MADTIERDGGLENMGLLGGAVAKLFLLQATLNRAMMAGPQL